MRHEEKENAIDPLKQEETAKRQKVINDVKLSLKQRRFDKIAIENAHSDGNEHSPKGD